MSANGEAGFRVGLINVLRGPIYRDEREGLWRQLIAARRLSTSTSACSA